MHHRQKICFSIQIKFDFYEQVVLIPKFTRYETNREPNSYLFWAIVSLYLSRYSKCCIYTIELLETKTHTQREKKKIREKERMLNLSQMQTKSGWVSVIQWISCSWLVHARCTHTHNWESKHFTVSVHCFHHLFSFFFIAHQKEQNEKKKLQRISNHTLSKK